MISVTSIFIIFILKKDFGMKFFFILLCAFKSSFLQTFTYNRVKMFIFKIVIPVILKCEWVAKSTLGAKIFEKQAISIIYGLFSPISCKKTLFYT